MRNETIRSVLLLGFLMALSSGPVLPAENELTPEQEDYIRNIYRQVKKADFSAASNGSGLVEPKPEANPGFEQGKGRIPNTETSPVPEPARLPENNAGAAVSPGVSFASTLAGALTSVNPQTLTQDKELLNSYLGITDIKPRDSEASNGANDAIPLAGNNSGEINTESAHNFLKRALKFLPPESPEAVKIKEYFKEKGIN